MRFELDDTHNDLYDHFRRLCEGVLDKDVAVRDRAGEFSHREWLRCAEGGLHGLLLPTEYGGGGHGPVAYVRAMEAMGYGGVDNGLMMSVGAHVLAVAVPIWLFGDDEQRRTYLPGLAAGGLIGANAMSEPGSGSDALSLTATAMRDGAGYRLNGQKVYVTNGPIADVFVVYATVDPRLGFTGVTAFLIERGDAGLSVRVGSEKLGLRTAPWGIVDLVDCHIPASRRLGAEKQGGSIFAKTMSWERALLVAPWLGVLEREIEECVLHARRRRQFGKHIGSFQAVANRLVDMRIRWEVSRMLTYRAASELDGRDPGIYPEMAKLYVSEAAVGILSDAMQIYGALGYTVDGRVERHLRDAYGATLSSGTSDLQRLVIASRLGTTWPKNDGSEVNDEQSDRSPGVLGRTATDGAGGRVSRRIDHI
ncbi:acyl-CoA dehydrogenase family protein [Micromonospora sp. NPDC049559]|uniref:acyl-CoA dehydrogenase family protein n=1 Tax=Micromonospora sp. NPDC049559 TaxID=3155923 RepID=UPI003438BCFC